MNPLLLNRKIWLMVGLLTAITGFAQVEQLPLDVQDRQIKRMANEFERSGELERAADIFYLLSLQNPADITSYAGAKRVMVKLQQLDRLQGLIQELQKSRRDVRFEIDLADIEYIRGNTKAAKARWAQVLENNAMGHSTYVLVGQVLMDHGLIDDAVECFLTGRKKLKNDDLFIFELASLYTHQAKYDRVTREFIKFLERNPKQLHYINSRFQTLESNKESLSDIYKALKNAIKTKPGIRLELHQLLGDVYSRNSRYEDALEQFVIIEDTLLQKKDPRSGLYLYQFAVLCTGEGELQIATDAFNTLINNYPQNKYTLLARLGFATILEYKGEYQQAINSYEQFVGQHRRSQEAQEALLKIGDIYNYNLNEPTAAVKTYQRLLKEYPAAAKRDETLFKMGECEIRNNKLGDARASFNMVLLTHKSKPNIEYKKALFTTAKTWFLQGNIEKCSEFLEQYFSTNIRNNKADIYENDALELNMLISENMMDSLGLVTFANARLLFYQDKLIQSDSLLTAFLESNPQTTMSENINMFRAEIYIIQKKYQQAIDVLNGVYENEQSLYQDKALWTLAGIYADGLQEAPRALELYESLLVNFPESIYIEETRKQIRNLQ